jgi:hypothetical protein
MPHQKLHNHPGLEHKLRGMNLIDNDHVVVDRKDWEEATADSQFDPRPALNIRPAPGLVPCIHCGTLPSLTDDEGYWCSCMNTGCIGYWNLVSTSRWNEAMGKPITNNS